MSTASSENSEEPLVRGLERLELSGEAGRAATVAAGELIAALSQLAHAKVHFKTVQQWEKLLLS